MTSKDIMQIVNKEFNLDVSIKTRKREVVYAKKVYIKLARECTLESLEQIGKNIDLKHDNICYHLRKIDCIFEDYKIKCNEIIKKYQLEAQPFKFSEEKKREIAENYILTHFNELSTLSDSELKEFKETRLKPFLMMLKSRKKHKKIQKVAGAKLLR